MRILKNSYLIQNFGAKIIKNAKYSNLPKTIPNDNNNLSATWRIQDGYSEFVATRDIKNGEELLQSFSSPNKVN